MIALFIIIVLLALVGIAFLYLKWRFRLASSNEALIITGMRLGNPEKNNQIFQDEEGRYMKVVRGGGHRLKMFQKSTKVDLTSFKLSIETPKVYTADGIGVFGDAVVTVRVSETLDGIVRYAEQYLGKKQEDISNEVSDVLSGNLRGILSKMQVKEINEDRNKFNEKVIEIAQEQMSRMGFKITSLNLVDIRDDVNYLENLGRPEAARVKKEAEVEEADNRQQTEIKEAEVKENIEKERYQREMNIADTRRDKELKDASIKEETERARAKAEASYNLEIKERNVEIEERKVEVRKQKAEADYTEEVRRADADAEVIRRKNEAEVEAMLNRTRAMDQYKQVIFLEKMIEQMPEFARSVSESLANVDSIRVLDSGDGKATSSLPKSVMDIFGEVQERMSGMTGVDLEQGLKDVMKQTEETAQQKEETPQAKQNESKAAEQDADASEAQNDTATGADWASVSGAASDSVGTEAEGSSPISTSAEEFDTAFDETADEPEDYDVNTGDEEEAEAFRSDESENQEEAANENSKTQEETDSDETSKEQTESFAKEKEDLKQHFIKQAEEKYENSLDDKTKNFITDLVDKHGENAKKFMDRFIK